MSVDHTSAVRENVYLFLGVVYLPDYIESDNEEWFKGHFAKSYLLVQNNLEINAMIMATI